LSGIFVVATGQDVGKTTTSISLISLLQEHGYRVGFMKPVGQQYVMCDGAKIDKDAVLMQQTFQLPGDLQDMSPVTVPRGFVEDYLFNRDPAPLRARIQESYARLSSVCDVVVVEGTGHAGVGSCFDLSNADVAALLGLKALIITEGGIGSALDQLSLNVSLFRDRQVEILGVMANKVFPDKLDRIARAVGQGLANMGERFLGAVPFEQNITYPHVEQLAKLLKAEVLCGEEALGRRVEHILVAAMEPQNVVPRIRPASLMITPGDRIDNILVALNSKLDPDDARGRVEALILTGGFMPHFTIINLLKKSWLPVLVCEEDTYSVSAKVQGKVFKMLPEDTDKIDMARQLIQRYIDTEAILAVAEGK